MTKAEAIGAALQWCETNPDQWRRGEISVSPAETGLSPAEIQDLFGWDTLEEVHRAVEQYLEHLLGRN